MKIAALIVGAFFCIAIIFASLGSKDDLGRYQQLKNKRRFSGKKLTPDEKEEADRLAKKYWWW